MLRRNLTRVTTKRYRERGQKNTYLRYQCPPAEVFHGKPFAAVASSMVRNRRQIFDSVGDFKEVRIIIVRHRNIYIIW